MPFRTPLSLQEIPAIGSLLYAVKWIGNDGAHDMVLKREDALDALVLVEEVLVRLFETKGSDAERLAKRINKSKKPRSRTRGRGRQKRDQA